MPKILIVNGSTRRGGFNEQLARKIGELIGERAEVSFLDWSDVPIYEQDCEYPAPAPVRRVRREVSQCDALWFVTPEYNLHIPGGLKNLTDWLSRSLDPDNSRGASAVHAKITTVSSASADGGSHVRAALEELLGFIRTDVVTDNATGVPIAHQSWTSDVLLFTDEDVENLQRQIESVLERLSGLRREETC